MKNEGNGKKTKEKKLATKPRIDERQNNKFPIVGIGASAGGLGAFEAFFSGMPKEKEPGMAFILVQHLAPEHESILSTLVQRYTNLKVFDVIDGMEVKPNCVYIIPPGYDMALNNGKLEIFQQSTDGGLRLPINFLFRSLAKDQKELAIGIILTGTGSDGTIGTRAIKAEGGIVMAQNPKGLDYDGMPVSAIGTGLVDYVLLPEEMPAALIGYVNQLFLGDSRMHGEDDSTAANELNSIFTIIKSQTGNDFSKYKISTIQRRIERRMAVNRINTMYDYVKYLKTETKEVHALFQDFLIGVTSFFRDETTFEALKTEIIGELLKGKPPGAHIRVWVAGCSTGEEAYSIAIMLVEAMEILGRSYRVQIFATDIDSRAIEIARAGVYSASSMAEVSAERRKKYFVAERDGNYRINGEIREMLIFSEHNLIKAPPFSKLELLCCRNLMIYLTGELQSKLVELFHFALKPGGLLFLGTSESIGDFQNYFDNINSSAKIYQKSGQGSLNQKKTLGNIVPQISSGQAFYPNSHKDETEENGIRLKELTEQTLLQQTALSGVLINHRGDVLYIHGKTGIYLESTPGEVGIMNILTMTREGLKSELTLALHEANKNHCMVSYPGIQVKTNSGYTKVNLKIVPVNIGLNIDDNGFLYLVVFEEPSEVTDKRTRGKTSKPQKGVTAHEVDFSVEVETIKRELQIKEGYLRATNEELKITNEELRSSNEEMQSVNEELQSTNEEMESSKEELQSLNEELNTVNLELQNRIADILQLNDDMNNLLSGSGVATIFVNNFMELLRFTDSVSDIINLIAGDVGRPLRHIVTNLVGYDRLIIDVQKVLDTLIPKELEVETTEGIWYKMRIQPYRTMKNVIEGAVITFFDIKEIVETREALRKANSQLRLAIVVNDSYDAITVQDINGQILAWNEAAEKMYGWSEEEAIGMNIKERIPSNKAKEEINVLHKLATSKIMEPYKTQRIKKTGEILDVWLTASSLMDEFGRIYAISTTERTIA